MRRCQYGGMFAQKKPLAALGVGVFIGVIAFYSYYQSRAIIAGPVIEIIEPRGGVVATTSLLMVRGVARHANEVTLQGRPIFIDLEGRFTEQLLLMDGYNIIEFTAKDLDGRIERKTVELIHHNEG